MKYKRKALCVFLLILSTSVFLHMLQQEENKTSVVIAYYYVWYHENSWFKDGEALVRWVPSLGHYRSQNPSVVHAHIDQARQAGIDVFAVSWWGKEDWRLEVPVAVMESENFKFCILFEGVGIKEGYVDAVGFIQDHFMSSLAYFAVDDRPVLIIYDTVDKLEAWKEVKNRFDGEISFWFSIASGPRNIFLSDVDELSSVFDVVDSYLPLTFGMWLPNINEALTEGVIKTALQQYFAQNQVWNQKCMYDSTTLCFGFDKDAVIPHADWIVDAYRTELSKNRPRFIFVTSWNEQFEHTACESNSEFGEKYLKIIKELAS